MPGAEQERVKSAASRLCAFFEELRATFVERDDVLKQIALALLSREHVLITGPPGTAKSRLAWAVLGRIVDENTGLPSIYSRQFTESTVQTDLVGPIDFKTLMETGRTEHFTDEGMLGAVHAFLDEVFDGRDMLLRSTLNVLHERELKQGTKVTRGRIECALLTTNRYLAEVLEGSREALLAFVDRIAHVAFVPKGFGDPTSLGRLLHLQLAGTLPRPLSAHLTVQDLDTLQALVDSVPIAPQLCDLLAEFVRSFEAEIAAAVRADPAFVPTRYLSTRTVVRLGHTLRAACVLDWAVNGQSRRLRVEQRDFASLRLALVLCGPHAEHIDALLQVEHDPRERHQLETIRTEQAIFVRCLNKLRDAELVTNDAVIDRALLQASEPAVLRGCLPKQLLETTRSLAEAVAGNHSESSPAAERLRAAVTELGRRAIQSGVDTGSGPELSPLDSATNLARLADEIERIAPSLSPLARWLRGQALELIQHALRLAPTTSGKNLDHWLESTLGVVEARAASLARVRRVAALFELQTTMIAKGATQPPGATTEPSLIALQRLQDDLSLLWDGVVRGLVEEALKTSAKDDLGRLLDAIQEPLLSVRAVEAALAKLGAPATLEPRVFGARLMPIVRASCERVATSDHQTTVLQLEQLLDTLDAFGLAHSVVGPELLGWVANAMLRGQPDWHAIGRRYERNLSGFRKLRAENERRSLAYTVAELALCLHGRSRQDRPAHALEPVKNMLAALPDGIRQGIIAADLARLEAPLALLEEFWRDVSGSAAGDPAERLAHLSRSRFLHVTRDDAALVRLALEIRLLSQLLPEADVAPVARRLSMLEQQTTVAVRELMGQQLDGAWRETLAPNAR